MKHLTQYINEGIFDDNVKNKIVPEKLAYILKKFFGPDVALCEDHQGSAKWYEINPLTIKITGNNLTNRIVKYCEKVDGLNIKDEILTVSSTITAKYIGDDKYWFRLNYTKYSSPRVKVSKEFYDSMALPHDQKGVVERGWKEWQRQRHRW